MIRDCHGNEITKGRFLYWKSKDLSAFVAEVFEDEHPPRVVLQVVLPIMMAPNHAGDVPITDFVCCIHPGQEAALTELMNGPKQ